MIVQSTLESRTSNLICGQAKVVLKRTRFAFLSDFSLIILLFEECSQICEKTLQNTNIVLLMTNVYLSYLNLKNGSQKYDRFLLVNYCYLEVVGGLGLTSKTFFY